MRILKLTARATPTALLVVVASLAVVMVLIPRVLGWVPLAVMSGSMTPAIPVGSQVVLEPIDGVADVDALMPGDVVTFMPKPDDPAVVTHRIVAKTMDETGAVSFTTQGDANDSPDAGGVTATQLRGVVKYHVPHAGHAANLLEPEQKLLASRVLAAVAFFYSSVHAVFGLRERLGARA